MKHLSVMIKPVSSACNLRCQYCFYADVAKNRKQASFGVMSEETTDKLLKQVLADLSPEDRITFAFQGGEPTLAGLDYYQHFAAAVDQWDKRIHVEYAFQTNGLLLDEAWCAFFAERGFLVGLSLDLPREQHDMNRVDGQGRRTYQRALQALKLLKRYRVEHNVLSTLTNAAARHPRQVWRTIEKLDLRYVQFTPCIGGLDGEENIWALTPERFAAFYISLFEEWSRAYWAGKYRSIKLFDDILNLLVRGIPTACGIDGKCRAQMVVEADGSVFPCDFYCLDEWKTGNILEQSPLELQRALRVEEFLSRPVGLPEACRSCRFFTMCGGGCARMRGTMCRASGACGYQLFLQSCLEPVKQIAVSLQQRWQ